MMFAGTGHDINGYGMMLIDNQKRQHTLELHTMDQERNPNEVAVSGWPMTIDVSN